MPNRSILVVVEAPKKVKIIQKILNDFQDGRDYTVMATSGHLLDIAKSKEQSPHGSLGIDLANHFEPHYIPLPEKRRTIAELRRAAKSVDQVWIASDLDHEGEFIGASLCHPELLNLPIATTPRLIFNEITKEAFQQAVANPQRLNQHLLDAQKCRRVLDRLIGFQLSAAARQINNNLVMGRVKTVMVKLVADDEAARQSFTPTTFYRGSGQFTIAPSQSTPTPTPTWNATAQTPNPLTDLTALQSWLQALQSLPVDQQRFTVTRVQDRPQTESPPPPFQTSTLQKVAARHFGTSPKAIMSAAQALYERGFISYPRTDTVRLPAAKMAALKAHIIDHYGLDYYQERHFKSGPHSQEAHSAIYPTELSRQVLSPEEFPPTTLEARLYRLIFQRTVASQMAPARKRRFTVTLQPPSATSLPLGLPDLTYQLEKVTIIWPGFLRVYGYGESTNVLPETLPTDEDPDQNPTDSNSTGDAQLLALQEGDTLQPLSLSFQQDWTRPPPRCDEIKLLDQLEKNAIGRPSTWAPLLAQVLDREYLIKEDRPGQTVQRQQLSLTLLPSSPAILQTTTDTTVINNERSKLYVTDLGRLMTKFADQFFPTLFNLQFTAEMEKRLDLIDEGQEVWWQVVQEVYQRYHPILTNYLQQKLAQTFRQKRLLGPHPLTGQPVYAYVARYGACIQIGEDQDKTKKHYPLLSPLTVETVQLTDLPRLTALPLSLGPDPNTQQQVTVKKGPYGLYFQISTPTSPEAKNYTVRADCFDPPLSHYTKPAQYLNYLDRLTLRALLHSAQAQQQAKAPVATYGPYEIRKTRNGRGHYLLHNGQIVTVKAELLASLSTDPAPEATLQALLANPPAARRKGLKNGSKAAIKATKPAKVPKTLKGTVIQKAPLPAVKPFITIVPKTLLTTPSLPKPIISIVKKNVS